MPATKNAMTRYQLIDTMLANRNRAYSIQDITDELGEKLREFGQEAVSKRCVEKDLNYLAYDSPFDVEIEEYWVDASDCNDRPYRRRCIRYADPTFSIFKSKLTDDEKAVLSTALDTLGSFDGLENFEWLRDLKERLHLEEHSAIISVSKNLLTNSTLLARLFTAIRLNQVISLRYHTFQDSSSRTVEVTPHLLKEYNNRWFLIVSACDTGKVLTFPLDRIDDFSNNYVAPHIKKPENLEERFEDIIGMTYPDNLPVESITFWISDISKDYIATKPIHGSQRPVRGETESKLRNQYPSLDSGAFYMIECVENYELIRELCSFGPELIVLSPDSIKNKITSRLRRMTEAYCSINKLSQD
jgi:predicted DNA-binding transcriptional regulator YafY